jgi:quinol monooxygenase YgiN/predicted small metal-binding protein
MTRKIIDCGTVPNERGCTLALTGTEEEVLAAAVAHAVAEHGHTDSPELRAALREALADVSVEPSRAGAFVQLIEFRTAHAGEWNAITDRLVASLGDLRTTRWSIVATDRDRPGTYVALVEFPDHAAAMANSGRPETAVWFKELEGICSGEPAFRNLDVTIVRPN